MNKAGLTEALASDAGIPKVHAARFIQIITKSIADALIGGDKVTISDFGTFTVSHRQSFKGYNPRNGKQIEVPARKIPVFRAGKALKEALNS